MNPFGVSGRQRPGARPAEHVQRSLRLEDLVGAGPVGGAPEADRNGGPPTRRPSTAISGSHCGRCGSTKSMLTRPQFATPRSTGSPVADVKRARFASNSFSRSPCHTRIWLSRAERSANR